MDAEYLLTIAPTGTTSLMTQLQVVSNLYSCLYIRGVVGKSKPAGRVDFIDEVGDGWEE